MGWEILYFIAGYILGIFTGFFIVYLYIRRYVRKMYNIEYLQSMLKKFEEMLGKKEK